MLKFFDIPLIQVLQNFNSRYIVYTVSEKEERSHSLMYNCISDISKNLSIPLFRLFRILYLYLWWAGCSINNLSKDVTNHSTVRDAVPVCTCCRHFAVSPMHEYVMIFTEQSLGDLGPFWTRDCFMISTCVASRASSADEVSTTAHQVVMALQFSVLGRVLPSARQPSFNPISKFMTLSSSKF